MDLLDSSLQAACGAHIEQLNVVLSVYSDAKSGRGGLVKSFTHASPVISVESTVLHEFNAARFEDRTALRATVHHIHLPSILASHGDARLNWVVVSSDVHVLLGSDIPSRSVVENSLLHG